MHRPKRRAFTLAEVLVTLAIIGMVAALTIPTLINNTTDAKLRAAWKKSVSTIAQATQMLAINDDIDVTSSATLRDSYETQMKFLKKDAMNNIFSHSYSYYKNSAATMDWSAVTIPAAILNDGAAVYFMSNLSNCTDTIGTLTGICGSICFDVNGKNPPNMYGKDYLSVWLVKMNGSYVVYPIGSNGDGFSCDAGSSTRATSEGCSAKALQGGDMP